MAEPVKPTPAIVRESTVDLAKSARVACAVLGVASEVFAAIVLWRGEGGAATVAFIVLGAILTVLAASGVIPRRIKSGDHEVEMLRRQVTEGVQESTDNALATMTRSEIEEFIEENLRSRARDSANQALTAASRAQEALDFKRETLLNIRNLVPSADIYYEGSETYKRWDAHLKFQNDTQIWIDLKWKFTSAAVRRLLSYAATDGSTVYWLIAHGLSKRDIAMAANLLAQQANADNGVKLVISSDATPNLHAVIQWLAHGGPHPAPTVALASF